MFLMKEQSSPSLKMYSYLLVFISKNSDVIDSLSMRECNGERAYVSSGRWHFYVIAKWIEAVQVECLLKNMAAPSNTRPSDSHVIKKKKKKKKNVSIVWGYLK